MHKVQVTPVIGLPKFDGWSHVAINATQNCVVSLAIQGQNARNIGRDIVAVIEAREVVTTADLNNLLLYIASEVRAAGATVSISAMGSFAEQVFFAGMNGAVVLKRGSKIGTVLSASGEVILREGTWQADDVVVLFTQAASDLVQEVKLKFQQGYDHDTVVTSLVSGVHRHPFSEQVALGFCTWQEVSTKIEDEPVVSVDILEEPSEATAPVLSIEVTPEVPQTPHEQDEASVVGGKAGSPPDTITLAMLAKHWRPYLVQIKHWFLHRWQQIRQRNVRNDFKKLLPLLVVGLIVAFGLGIWQRQRAAQAQTALSAVQPTMLEITTLASGVSDNPVEVRKNIQERIDQLSQLKPQFSGQSVALRVIDEQIAAAETILETVSGQQAVDELPMAADLQSISPDWIGQRMDADATQAAILDVGKQQVVKFSLADQSLATWTALKPAGDTSIKDLSVADGLVTYLAGGVRQSSAAALDQDWQELKPSGDSNREANLIASYGPYIYVVNPVRRNIYRYTQTRDEVSEPIGWLRPGTRLNFEQINSIAIDGEVWLGMKNGEILRFATGDPQDFQLRGLSTPLSSPITVYTKDFLENLYVLEPAAKRVIVLRKNGDFVKEVTGLALGTATDLVASETLKNIWVVSGSAVFAVAL